jgi:hypothetical protein
MGRYCATCDKDDERPVVGSRIGGRLALFGGNVLATVTAKLTDARGGAYGAFGRDCKFEFSVRMAARPDADMESQGSAKRFFEILIRTPDTRGLLLQLYTRARFIS